MLKSPKKQSVQNNYKYIHMKNLNLGGKQIPQSTNNKNMQYFPGRAIKRQSASNHLDTSKSNTTNRENSQTSRYSKRQSTFTSNVQQQNRKIIKQNEKLKKQLKRIEKILIQKEDNVSNTKQLQLELVETYRVINYYEGKIKQLEKICKFYQKQFDGIESKKAKSAKISIILQDLRNSNSELRGKNQQKQMEIQIITSELRKIQSKFHMSQQKILQLNKKANHNKLALSKPKFIDDYQQKNLNCQSEPNRQYFVKRRPELSKSKRILRTTPRGQSDSDGSGVSSQYKNSVYIRRKQNGSKSREDSLRQSKQKSIAFGNLSSRLNIIENEVESLKKENEKLHEQLDLKIKEIIKLKQQNEQHQNKLKNTFPQQKGKGANQNELKLVSISNNKLREIQDPTLQSNSISKKVEQNNLSKFVSNISMNKQSSNSQPSLYDNKSDLRLNIRPKQSKKKSGYSFKDLRQKTIRKLIINIARQDVAYTNLIDNIADAWTSDNPNCLIQLLEEFPYQLNSAETSQFMFEYKNIMKFISSKQREAAHKDMNEQQYKRYVSEEIKSILRDNISFYKNVTIRRDFTLNVQLANKFKNYEKQLEDVINRYGNKLPMSQWEKIFINKWGLTAEESLIIQIKNYQFHSYCRFRKIFFDRVNDNQDYFYYSYIQQAQSQYYQKFIKRFTRSLLRMFDKALKPYRKRLDTEIITKADIAFDAIKRYELEQSRVYFHKNRKNNEKNLLTELDKDYSKLTPHKKIQLDQVYHISLFTYSQQFYYLEMINYVFPMRVFFKNVKNDGVLYIGYDQQYPGIEHHNKLSIFQSEVGQNQRNYDHKETICKDMLIILKNKGNKMVKYIYFTISAGSSLLMFDFKVEFFGLIKNNRVLSQDKLRNLTRVNLGKGWQKTQRLVYNNSQQQKQGKQSKLPEISQKNIQKAIKVNQFQVFTQQIHKHFSKGSISPQKQLTSRKDNPNNSQLLNANKKSSSHQILKQTKLLGGINVKGDVDLKLQEKKRNKQLYEIFKQKDKQLRELSGKCKRLIQDYQKTYNEESVRKRKLNKDLAIIVYSMLYVNKINKKCQKAVKRQKMAFKVIYLCRKFIKKLKKRYEQTCKMQPFRYKRMMAEQLTGLQAQSKLILKNSIVRASKQVRDIFSFLQPIISLNKSFLLSDIYRNKIILIQKAWKSKYHNRIKSLLQFIDRHVQKMTKEYQNLKIFIDDFYGKEVNKQICLNYIKDQSQKYRFIYDAYQRKLEQIDEINQVNSKISIQSPNNKSRIMVPKKPIRPMHRFFRNIDILKSMVRSWFQIQFKKYSRKVNPKSFK